jgi:hypothetical protein
MKGGRMPAPGKHVLLLPVVAAAVLVPWTVGIAMHLPHSAVAHHWNTAWAGLDVAIMVGLVLISWLGRRRDRRVVLVATATATLTCVDAWFDVCTSASGSPLAWAVAEAAAELLVAAACLVIGRRSMRERRPLTGRRRTTTEHR